MTADPPTATAAKPVAPAAAESDILREARRLAAHGWGRLTITAVNGTLHIVEYAETYELPST